MPLCIEMLRVCSLLANAVIAVMFLKETVRYQDFLGKFVF